VYALLLDALTSEDITYESVTYETGYAFQFMKLSDLPLNGKHFDRFLVLYVQKPHYLNKISSE
jgi:hypothetical protein